MIFQFHGAMLTKWRGWWGGRNAPVRPSGLGLGGGGVGGSLLSQFRAPPSHDSPLLELASDWGEVKWKGKSAASFGCSFSVSRGLTRELVCLQTLQ